MDVAAWDKFSKYGVLRSVLDPNDELGFKNLLIDRMQWTALKKHLAGRKNILDFGCGSGRMAPRAKALGIKYSGIDTSPGMIETAKKTYPEPSFTFKHFDGF